ncbi:hypothetical protein SAMN05880582_103264 [Rhizobium sp. RU20A]|uniref:hypothetical protein n=1 Tax=Rhizobium sp. RU20A TaxID=1907412 RepID=UPI00095648B8|nr:hypothetical protein [Rhizobium sp. RU20A]SIQ76515.1 hypothetical protein SAMN05880582_103264 [Rhizobium sp. RU20A]
MRLIFRLASFFALVAAVLLATVDAVQSVSAGSTILVRFGDVVTGLDPSLPGRLAAFPGSLAGAFGEGGANLGRTVMQWLLDRPAAAVMLGLALVFWIIGYRRTPRITGMPTA